MPSQVRYKLPKGNRLLKSASFGEVLSSRGPHSFRSASGLLTVCARFSRIPNETGFVRFGFTVGKSNAHRAVDRVLIKRVLRDSARHMRPVLGKNETALDVVIRLKRPVRANSEGFSAASLKKSLRSECDRLLSSLSAYLDKRDSGK